MERFKDTQQYTKQVFLNLSGLIYDQWCEQFQQKGNSNKVIFRFICSRSNASKACSIYSCISNGLIYKQSKFLHALPQKSIAVN
jgi:hypothetical protein